MSLSPDLKDAVNHLQSHAQGLKAVIAVADAISNIAALEQLAAEAVNRKDAADAALAKAKAALVAAEADLQDAKQAAEKVKKASTDNAAKSATKADDLVRDAEKKAAGIINQAIADSTARVATAIKDRSDELAGIEANLAAGKADREALDADIIVKSGEVADLESRAAKARKYLDKLTKDD